MAAALEAEKTAHRETQHQLEKRQRDADSMRKSWLEAANHLNRALRQGQAVNQMTDDELIHKAAALRFRIKNFALQFFGDELKGVHTHTAVDFLSRHLNLSPRSLRVYLRSSSLRPMLVRSFLWCFLRKAVFGRFRWVPQEASTAMLDLNRLLRNLATADGSFTAESAREFHMWRAKTSNLLFEATEPEAAAGYCRQESVADAHYIFDMLAPYSAANPQVIGPRLFDIIYQSLELDKQFSMQVAKLRWTNINIPVTAFDPRVMEVDRGQTYASPEQQVQLVLSPSLEKWGKSSGEDFDLSTTLLKMEVSIQAQPQSYMGALYNVFTGTPRGPPA
ncbi:hypothetical protein BR93DRAFT_986755 [Coniochaeta sp. PMI_546]|nr:hypothetical protein BR93DRAFT_986755 [Coniochaeta sp. PMI_546]